MMKSLQSKMILVMFLFILIVMIFSAFFSIVKMEQVYSNGFVEEMLNTIPSFSVPSPNDSIIPSPRKDSAQEEFINRFSIYFSLNNTARRGSVLDENLDVLYTNKDGDIPEELLAKIRESSNIVDRPFELINDYNTNEYYFMYFVRDEKDLSVRNTLLIEQDKAYINNQLKEVIIIYVASMVVISIMTLVVSALLAANVTKPIEVIRKKAQLIAAGSDIEEIILEDSQKSEDEVVRLVESFNLMIGQIKSNLNEISNEKNKLEAIILHLSDGVLAFNTSGELILANTVAKELLKIGEENNFEEIFKKLQIDINMEKIMYLDDWTSTEQSVKFEDLILNMFFASFKNEEDDFGGLVCVVHDVTKQVQLEEMRKEFVANVSHELKTPLTSIKTYTETLLDQDMRPDDEEATRFLNVILSESNRMTRLVSDLLQLTKFDYKKVAWNKLFFDLGELAKQVCEKHMIQAETKHQNLECYITSNVPMVYADRDGIEQVITNILTNSIKYTKEDGNIKMYVGCVHDDAYIKIIDDGVGIPEADIPRVFERFYRVDKARSREMGGTGLGLPIAKEIIEANGGSIDIKSELGKGTEVIIKVPIKDEESLKS